MKVHARFRTERLGDLWLVLDADGSQVLRLHGAAAEVLTRLEAGEVHLPDHLGPAMDGLIAAGVLDAPPGVLSRRHLLGASAATAAVTALGATIGLDALRLPAAAEACSLEPATGGTVSEYTFDNVTYRVHTFNAGGTFTVNSSCASLAVEVLVVGGGGGGGGSASGVGGGGGGGGGVLFKTNLNPIGPGGYAVTVGAGGAGGASGVRGSNGGASSFSELVSVLGGGGGGGTNEAGAKAGGSGGGGSGGDFSTSPGGGSEPEQGSNGGDGFTTVTPADAAGGGGGGAGGGGIAAIDRRGGDGGVGRLVGVAGLGRYFGAGGAGSGTTPGAAPTGGGGGAAGADGTANTGGGGGAQTNSAAAGTGGSGIVIVRYPFTPPPGP